MLYPENIPEQIALGCLVQHWHKPAGFTSNREPCLKAVFAERRSIAALLGGRSPTTVWKEIRSEGNQTQKPVGPPEPTVGATTSR